MFSSKFYMEKIRKNYQWTNSFLQCTNAKYVANWYEKATVVFNGYEDRPSIKDAVQCRHTGSSKEPNLVCT